ncbi:hypothetical protein [Paenibacillus wulumuqiensis]|uniref:hypothetical protein n=1 Tax=Paenibacillus wulumuqiensis TaxID=1567107 RepID=UPI000619299E|nr:hypothetical protein [Paenibacillus wulumuqiensis]
MKFDIITWLIGIDIAIMFFIFVFQFKKIFSSYDSSQKAATLINEKLEELKKEVDVNQRFLEFDKWLENQKNSYIKQSVLPSWKQYYEKFQFYQKEGIVFTPDIYDFFFEEPLVQEFGKRKFAEIIPGIFLSLGILGTFFSIAIGVSGLSISGETDTMQAGIEKLLQGMQMKFSSSIAGILFSLIWQWLDKSKYYPKLINSFNQIRQSLDEAFPTQDSSTVIYTMNKNQEQQMKDFQTFLSDVLIPNMVHGVAESIQKSITPHLEQTQQIMGDLIQSSSVNQAQGMQQMVDQFVTQLNELTGDHMKNLGEALHSTIEWQQKVHEEMGALVQSMQDSAKEQSTMVEKTTLLTEQIHEYTEHITYYQSVLETTVEGLNKTTEKNSQLQSVTTTLLEKMTEERQVFNDYFNSHIGKLKENVDSFVAQTTLQVTFQQRLEENLQRIANITQSQQTLAVTLSHQADLSQRSNQELEDIFDKFKGNNNQFVNLQEDLHNLIVDIQEERRELDQIASRTQSMLSDQLENMDERVEQLTTVWESTSETMSRTNKHLEVAMNQFTEDMHRGLEHTLNQFDQELSKSVQYLANGVDSIREGVEDMPETLDSLKQVVNEMKRQAVRLPDPV